jgi:hypothetical protein
MNTLYTKIIEIYPQLANTNLHDEKIFLQDDNDGKGIYLAKWEHPTLARPTDEELA